MINIYIDVVFPLPFPQIFTYRCPDTFDYPVKVGTRALVPFRSRKLIGYVVGNGDKKNRVIDRKIEIKDVIRPLDPEPIIDTHLLKLTKWISQYYLCSWGEAIQNALPTGLNMKHKEILVYQPHRSNPLLDQSIDMSHPRGKMLHILKETGQIELSVLKKRMNGTPDFQQTLSRLIYSKAATMQTKSIHQKITARFEKTVQLLIDNEKAADLVEQFAKKAPRRSACLEYLVAYQDEISLRQVAQAGYSRSIVSWLVKNEIARYGRREVFRDPLQEPDSDFDLSHRMTLDQEAVCSRVRQAIRSNRFQTQLLHGVTGSGKTRIYIEACRSALKQNKQALILVPEIALTPQTVSRFQAAFGKQVGLWHSRLSDGERYDIWRRVRQGEYDVMVGVRSAIFLPLQRLGLIIVDEEHETSFKQDSTPRYNARDTAIMRAKMLHSVCLLGSATPCLESYRNATQKCYELLELPKRIARRPLPKATIVDMRRHPVSGRISGILKEKIEQRIENREGIILFLNRRGFSTLVLCQKCGHSFECVNCHVTLTYHASTARIKCHYCDYTKPAPQKCESCGSDRLSFRGAGTQRIEDEVQQLFPTARILRMDVDTTSAKGAHHKILSRFQKGLADILLGTQMVAKGLDFHHVTLVGVISADVSLNLPDFRSAERTFQILTQVAGRAGRGKKKGEVVIQTYAPNHYALLYAKNHDYHAFYNQEMRDREELAYPPFNRIMTILISGTQEPLVIQAAEEINQEIRRVSHPSVAGILGPAPAPISKIKGKYRWQIFIKSDNNSELRWIIHSKVLPIHAKYENVSAVVNVDPTGM